MSDKPIIEHLVEAIKGYFSITGLIIIGVYLVKEASDAPFHLHFINYVSGFLAIAMGSIIGVWYSIHTLHKLLIEKRKGAIRYAEFVVYGSFILFAFLVVASIVAGAVSMSCGQVF